VTAGGARYDVAPPERTGRRVDVALGSPERRWVHLIGAGFAGVALGGRGVKPGVAVRRWGTRQ
jgi:hypothetical protein